MTDKRAREVVRFKDRFGDEQTLTQVGRKRFAIASKEDTPTRLLNRAAAKLIGARIKQARLDAGLTMPQLAIRAGLKGIPKVRVWEIENAIRDKGILMGTLFSISLALGIEATTLMPSANEVKNRADLEWTETETTLAPKN